VARPDDARISQAVSARLQGAGGAAAGGHRHRPRVADVRARLGFEPAHLVGNHGAEDAAATPRRTARVASGADAAAPAAARAGAMLAAPA
jgi:trehalose 6-phosphate phosphatase